MMLFSFFILFILLINGFGQKVCSKLHVGTQIGPNAPNYDVIQNGVPTSMWNPEMKGAPVVSASKNLDFFYLPEVDFELEQNNINLFYDNSEHVQSQAVLKKEDKGWYTVEVSYACDSYGGTLVNFRMEINVPGCGGAAIAWKKLCGNPYTEREGLTVEMIFDDFKEVIVKNGKPLNPKYFDRDIDNYAFLLPTFTNKVRFEMYMNYNDILNATNATTVHAFSSIEQNTDKKFNANTYVARVRADSDQSVVNVQVEGELASRGNVLTNTSKEIVDMIFHCTRKGGNSTIEFDILLPVFKDISLFFVKNCPTIIEEKSVFSSFTLWFTILAVLGLCYITYRNVTEKGKKGITALPLYDEIQELYEKIKGVSKIQKPNPLQDHELSGVSHQKLNFADEGDDFKGLNVDDDDVIQTNTKANTYGTL